MDNGRNPAMGRCNKTIIVLFFLIVTLYSCQKKNFKTNTPVQDCIELTELLAVNISEEVTRSDEIFCAFGVKSPLDSIPKFYTFHKTLAVNESIELSLTICIGNRIEFLIIEMDEENSSDQILKYQENIALLFSSKTENLAILLADDDLLFKEQFTYLELEKSLPISCSGLSFFDPFTYQIKGSK